MKSSIPAVYCINPDCNCRQNPADLEFCQACGTPLLIRRKYRLLHPLRVLDSERSTEIFEVEAKGERKVMKILKKNSPKLVELFQREALALETLDHKNIPALDLNGEFTLTLKTGKTLHCLVMDKIEGKNLEQYLEERGKIPYQTARRWTIELLQLLNYIHKQGFFHRDIKPSNLMIKPDGSLAIIDFGSVKKMSAPDGFAFRGGRSSSQSSVTSIVSRGYTAPEQVNSRATLQSDLFALGRTLVYLLAGMPPNELPTDPKTGKLLWRKRASRVPALFADAIDDLMAPSLKDRPKDSETALKYLENLRQRSLERFLNSSRFKAIAIGSASCLILLGIAGIFVYRSVVAPLQAKAYSEQGRKALQEESEEKLTIARRNFERAIALDPEQAIYYNDLGLVCTLQKDFECAKKNYQKSLSLETIRGNFASSYYNLGALYEERQEFKVALNAYELAMKTTDLSGILAKNSYARLKIWQAGESELAILVLDKALREIETLTPISETEKERALVTTYQNLGWAYLQQGNYPKARRNLQQAIALEKERRAAPYCLMAKVLQAEGKGTKALRMWQSCRDRDAGQLPEVKTWQGDAHQYLNFQQKKAENRSP